MKKCKVLLMLMLLGIAFAFSPIMVNNNRKLYADYNADFNLDNENPKNSKVSGPIYIDDTNPSYNWSVTKDAGICTGNGTYSEPYVIEDLVIDGGSVGSCILIKNSDVYFRIENCTVYNSGNWPDYSGIRLTNVKNSQLINNNCSFNTVGVWIENSDNNTVSGNIANNVTFYYGINIIRSDNNTISGNTANHCEYGITLTDCDYNVVSGNTANYKGLGIFLDGDSDNNIITGNTANYDRDGIYLRLGSDNNIITENTASYNRFGIYLRSGSNNNIITGNTLIGNDECIVEEEDCEGNIFRNNNCGGKEPAIPGFNLFFLLGILAVILILISKKVKKS